VVGKGSQVIKTSAEVCSLCAGTGWKTVPAGGSSSSPVYRERRVARCDCQLQARAESLLAAAHIPRRYEHCELANFEFDGRYRSLAPARMAACRFVEQYPVDKTGLLLIGSIGVGKTHVAVGIIKELIRGKGISCLFCDYRELLKQIQNSYNDTVKTTELDVLRPVFETEVLVLDELGAVRPTDWVWDTVSLILNTRYNNKLTTVITTNFLDGPSARAEAQEGMRRTSREDMLGDRVGDRMRSRLHEMCRIVTMEGADFRQKVKSASFP
jgi:DNA replication protein DnaC